MFPCYTNALIYISSTPQDFRLTRSFHTKEAEKPSVGTTSSILSINRLQSNKEDAHQADTKDNNHGRFKCPLRSTSTRSVVNRAG